MYPQHTTPLCVSCFSLSDMNACFHGYHMILHIERFPQFPWSADGFNSSSASRFCDSRSVKASLLCFDTTNRQDDHRMITGVCLALTMPVPCRHLLTLLPHLWLWEGACDWLPRLLSRHPQLCKTEAQKHIHIEHQLNHVVKTMTKGSKTLLGYLSLVTPTRLSPFTSKIWSPGNRFPVRGQRKVRRH